MDETNRRTGRTICALVPLVIRAREGERCAFVVLNAAMQEYVANMLVGLFRVEKLQRVGGAIIAHTGPGSIEILTARNEDGLRGTHGVIIARDHE